MTTTQAIDLLDRAVAQIDTTRANHNALQQALAVLREATAPRPADVPAKKSAK